jgi:tol-pal system protein YbgF
VTAAAYRAVLVAVALAGCGGIARQPAGAESTRAAPDAANPSSRASADQARLNEQVSRIAGELTELQNAVAKLIASSRQQEEQAAYLRRRVEELESLNRGRAPTAPSGFAPSPGPAPITSGTTTPAAQLYRTGTDNLQAKKYDAAMLSFYDLIATYPDDPLREDAQFLVADIYFTQRDFRGALAEFEALIAAVPRGERVPDALLRIGHCQKNLGDAGRAKRTWERVVRDHPASVAARQARVLLRN